MAASVLPTDASVVIIGGGVIGLSTAYRLAVAGVKDVVLLEANEFGSGSTCKAAGGIRTLFSDPVNIELGRRSLRAFGRFGQDFGQEIDFHQVGYLLLLDQPEQVESFEKSTQLQRDLGIESHLIDAAEARRRSPLIRTEGILAAVWSPQDGHCTPEAVVLGYATAARAAGARLVRNCAVTGVRSEGGDITAVETSAGVVRTDTIICCAGAWSQQIGDWVGVGLPVTPYRHQIVTTGPIDGLDPSQPFTIDFSSSFYFHVEGRGLLLGMAYAGEKPGFNLERTDDWLADLGVVIERRAPSLAEVGIASGWAGLYEVTPDHNALIGEAPGVSRFLYATGFSGHGFLMAPAVGEVMRDLFLGERPCVDTSDFAAERFLRGTGRPELNVI